MPSDSHSPTSMCPHGSVHYALSDKGMHRGRKDRKGRGSRPQQDGLIGSGRVHHSVDFSPWVTYSKASCTDKVLRDSKVS